jgi:hypothetical protein
VREVVVEMVEEAAAAVAAAAWTRHLWLAFARGRWWWRWRR